MTLYRDFRREEPPSDMGAKAHGGLSGAWEYERDMTRECIQHTGIVVRTLGSSMEEPFLSFVGQFAS